MRKTYWWRDHFCTLYKLERVWTTVLYSPIAASNLNIAKNIQYFKVFSTALFCKLFPVNIYSGEKWLIRGNFRFVYYGGVEWVVLNEKWNKDFQQFFGKCYSFGRKQLAKMCPHNNIQYIGYSYIYLY